MRFLLLAIALTSLVLTPAATDELLDNGSFEDGMNGFRTLSMTGTCTFELDKKLKKSGKRSLRIERAEGQKVDWVKFSAELPRDEGEIEVSAWYAVDKPGDVRITVYFSDEKGDTIDGFQELVSSGSTRKKWKDASSKYGVPEGAKSVGIDVWLRKPGTVWIDDFSIAYSGPTKSGRESAAEYALVNPDFSKGLDGWTAFGPDAARVEGKSDKQVGGKRKGALRLEREGARLFPEGGHEQLVTCRKRQKRATLACAVRVEEGAHGSVVLQALDKSGALLASTRIEIAPTKKKFERGSLELALPRGTQFVAVMLGIGGSGKAWFDDLDLGGR